MRGARPNKLFDYMAAGLPIVVNMDGEARSIVEDAHAGVYIPAEDALALANAIRELSDAADRRRTMGEAGFTHVSQAHSRETTARVLADVLESIAFAEPTDCRDIDAR